MVEHTITPKRLIFRIGALFLNFTFFSAIPEVPASIIFDAGKWVAFMQHSGLVLPRLTNIVIKIWQGRFRLRRVRLRRVRLRRVGRWTAVRIFLFGWFPRITSPGVIRFYGLRVNGSV